MLLACSTKPPGDAADGSASLDSGVLTATEGATSASTGGGSAGTSASDGSATGHGFKFDVGDGETEGSTGGPQLGSCRASEIYGAAGGYPAFNDPAYASFTSTVLIMTSHDTTGPSRTPCCA